MLSRSNDTLTLYGAIGTSILWTVGLILAATSASSEELAFLFIAIAALATALLMVHRWMVRMQRAWMHGFHFGYHMATDSNGCQIGEDCAVLDLAEVRQQKLNQLA